MCVLLFKSISAPFLHSMCPYFSPKLLEFLSNWASEASPTLGCSIEILRDIYIYVCMSTIVYGKPIQIIRMLKCVGRIM